MAGDLVEESLLFPCPSPLFSSTRSLRTLSALVFPAIGLVRIDAAEANLNFNNVTSDLIVISRAFKEIHMGEFRLSSAVGVKG